MRHDRVTQECGPTAAKVERQKGEVVVLHCFLPKVSDSSRRGGVRGNLHIICSACISLKAPTFWKNCNLEVMIIEKDDLLGATFCVEDVAADFVVRCRSLHFEENADPLF